MSAYDELARTSWTCAGPADIGVPPAIDQGGGFMPGSQNGSPGTVSSIADGSDVCVDLERRGR